MVKRSFDVLMSFVGIVALLPLFVLISIWVKYDSSGPVFFRQERVGQFGNIFRIFKFRTMHLNTEYKSSITIGDDPRITTSGLFLRKYKIDELPQLLDVFLGRMSFVGPRPELAKYIDMYEADIKKKVLSVKPGITDRASIEMVDENEILAKYENAQQAYIEVILPIKQKYYLEYINSRSFIGDCLIIISTLVKIIERK
jgi:lipopolysaccharide/colanic/teichoic acid biosynthesis glycosyltransferase